MLIHNKKAFSRGLLLLVTFTIVLVIFFMPVFPAQEAEGGKTNGLVFADHLFNTLSKGSSNFITPGVDGSIIESTQARTQGKNMEIEIPFKDTTYIPLAAGVLTQQGLEVSANPSGLTVKGELFPVLNAAIEDSRSFYNNKQEEVSERYEGADGRAIMKTWWQALSGMIKPLQKAGMVDEAAAVSSVISKAVEPSYNFYGITPMRVVDNIPLVAGFLIFYVLYTMWYGFAIFELFEGIGLTMKKSVKQEV